MEREEILMRLGKRLRELRTAKGLSQEELAQVATVDRGYISETETGDRNPSVWVVYRLAKALTVEPGMLLPDYDD